MDFERVLKALLVEFGRHQIRYAMVGGFAMGVLGFKRFTMDVDFLVHRDDLERLHRAMTTLGYRRFATTENVSHYVHPDAAWGGVDFLHAFRAPALAMLERAKGYAIFEGTQHVRVVAPEDAIAFKVQAMANNPKRRTRELADIEALMELYGSQLDWGRIQEYFDLFELGEEGRRLRERFGHAE